MVYLFVILTVLFSFAAVSAEQDGYNCWCNVDQYGCWITSEDGEQIYLMFWSESARQFFMGDSTPPYKDVVAPAEGARLSLLCGTPEIVKEANDLESICAAFAAFVNKCKPNANAQASDCVAAFIDNGGAAQAQKNFEEAKARGCSAFSN